MEKLKLSMEAGVATIVATLAGLDWYLVYFYCFLMTLDLTTGWYKAVKNGEFESKKMKDGLMGKVIELVIVFALLFLQRAFADIGIIILTGNVILFGFAIKECMSVLENWTQAGNKIPAFVESWLKVAKNKFEEQIKIEETDKNKEDK